MHRLFSKTIVVGLVAIGWVTVGLAAFPPALPAQYMVYAWENFETGEFPASLTRMHGANPKNVTVYEYPAAGAPAGMVTPASRAECGRYGLKFESTPKADFLTVMSGLVLDRARIGPKGRALFQADFFVGDEASYFPNLAVVAYGGKGVESKHRFGVLLNKSLYFSFLNGKKPEPTIMEQQPLASFGLERPGWHRFQIIFEGQDTIRLAVDGRQTSFSPVKEGTIANLQLGIMLAGGKNEPRTCYLDNLSIQYTPEDVPLPDSPWSAIAKGETRDGSGVAAGTAGAAVAAPGSVAGAMPGATPGAVAGGAPGAAPAPTPWFTSPEEAWFQANATKRPIVAYFHVPRSKLCESFESLLQTDPAISAQMTNLVRLKVDLNSLSGGMIGQKFQIYRIPSFVIVMPDGKEVARQVFAPEILQPEVMATLQKAME